MISLKGSTSQFEKTLKNKMSGIIATLQKGKGKDENGNFAKLEEKTFAEVDEETCREETSC